MTSLFRNIAVNIWWTPLKRFNTTDCEGMKSFFGSCLIYKNSIFVLTSVSVASLIHSQDLSSSSHLRALGTRLVGFKDE